MAFSGYSPAGDQRFGYQRFPSAKKHLRARPPQPLPGPADEKRLPEIPEIPQIHVAARHAAPRAGQTGRW